VSVRYSRIAASRFLAVDAGGEVVDGQQQPVQAEFLLGFLGGLVGGLHVGADAGQAQGIDADVVLRPFPVADDVVGVGTRLHHGHVAGQFQLADLVLVEEAHVARLLQLDHVVQAGDPEDFPHVARVGLLRADRVDLVEAAEDAARVGVFHLPHQDVRRVHVDAQDVAEVGLGFQRDQVVVRRHQAQFADIGEGVPRFDRDHQGVDLANLPGEAAAVAFLQQLHEEFLEEIGVQLVAVAREVEGDRDHVSNLSGGKG